MHLKFNCPQCGLALEASADNSGGAAECPECGKQFIVEAQLPEIPVVQARAVPTMEHRQIPRSLRGRPPAPRPQAVEGRRSPSSRPATESRMPFYGLGAAALLLVGLVLWLNLRRPKPEPEPVAAVEEKSALSSPVVQAATAKDPEKDRLNEELKKIKDALAASEMRDRERDERLFDAAQAEVMAGKQQQRDQIHRYLARTFFDDDNKAVDVFLAIEEDVLWGVSNLMSDENPDNDLRTRSDFEDYMIQRLLVRFDETPVLKQWLKDHGREPRMFIEELVRAKKGRAGFPDHGFDLAKYGSGGSGFWISSDGWIVTNEHVVPGAKVVDLRLRDGQVVQARVVETDPANDLALLKAEHAPETWHAISTGDTDLELGRTVFTVGYPNPVSQGIEPKFTDGRISAASGIGDSKDSYQITVPLQPGNSGGALVDFATGWVVGVVNASLRGSGGIAADNVSYAIKCKVVSDFIGSVPEAKAATSKIPQMPLAEGNERAVIDRATDSSVLILLPR